MAEPEAPSRTYRIQIENAKSPDKKQDIVQIVKDLAPIFTGLGTLALSVISFYFVHTLDREKAVAAQAELRQKAIAGYTESDATKREVLAVGLAGYGIAALPALHMLLSGEEQDMRDYAVLVAKRLFSSGDAKQRSKLMDTLISGARSPGINTRIGAYQCLVGISRDFSDPEKKKVLALLGEQFGPDAALLEEAQDTGVSACLLCNSLGYVNCRSILSSIFARYNDQRVREYVLNAYEIFLKKLVRRSGADYVKDVSAFKSECGSCSLSGRIDALYASAARKFEGVI